MIRVACLLLLTVRALAAPPHAPAPRPLLRDTTLLQPQTIPIVIDFEDRPEDLLIRTIMKFKRNAPADNRKQFVVKSPCQKDQKCAHTQLYEFDVFRVEPSMNGKRNYY